jgi:hypothetical protein
MEMSIIQLTLPYKNENVNHPADSAIQQCKSIQLTLPFNNERDNHPADSAMKCKGQLSS